MSFPVSSSRPWPLTDISCSNMPREISFPQSSASSRVAKKRDETFKWNTLNNSSLCSFTLCRLPCRVECRPFLLHQQPDYRHAAIRPEEWNGFLNPSKDANHWNDFPQRRLSRQLWTQLATGGVGVGVEEKRFNCSHSVRKWSSNDCEIHLYLRMVISHGLPMER